MSQQFLSCKEFDDLLLYTGNLTFLSGALGELAPTLVLY
jgi:hypothetical protein